MKKVLKNKVFLHIILSAVLCLCMAFLAEEIAAFKKTVYYALQDMKREYQEAQASLPDPFVHEEDAWYLNTPLIYHAAGAVDGINYTNSIEAIENTLAKGNRTVEIDFLFTTDGHLICGHGWTDLHSLDALSLEEVIDTKLYRKYTPMLAEDLVDYMRRYPDLRVITDVKQGITPAALVAELLRLCGNDPELMNRFVIQVYESGMKQDVLTVYPFEAENFLFTAYRFGADRIAEIRQICFDEEIFIVTVPMESYSKRSMDYLLDYGIIVFEHTVNEPEYAQEAMQRGVSGFYTDYMQEYQLQPEASQT